MAAAIEEESAAAAAGDLSADAAGGPGGDPLDMPEFTGQGHDGKLQQGIDLLHAVGLRVKIELGRTDMLVENVLKLGEGSVVELDKLAGDPVDVFANDRLIARGEVLVLNDNFCVRISEIVSGMGQVAARG
ncbi:MAG: flagellar motor switch protein FliN [bacterium]|nr:flagellar motor switch protein FliN [bacterium]